MVTVATQVSAVCYILGPMLIPVPIALQGRRGGSVEARSEQFDPNHLRSAERNSRPGIQRPPASALECTFGSGQDSGDAHDLVQYKMLKMLKGRCRCSIALPSVLTTVSQGERPG